MHATPEASLAFAMGRSEGRNATTTAARTESKYTQATQVLSLYTSRLEINGRGNSMPAAADVRTQTQASDSASPQATQA